MLTCVDIVILLIQAGTLGVIAWGVHFAKEQIKKTVAANKASNFFALVAYLQREEVREARRQVHNLGPYDTWRFNKEACEAAQQVASSFDIAAVAMINGLIDAEVFAMPWGPAIESTYEVVKGYIKDRQDESGHRIYLAHYVWLARLMKSQSHKWEFERPNETEPYAVGRLTKPSA